MPQRNGQMPNTSPTPGAAPKSPAFRDCACKVEAAAELDARQFVHDVEPLLARQDIGGLIRLLARYDCQQICALLSSPQDDARKVAALALALVGQEQAVPALAEHLRDADPMVNQMAEHALWSIWFRGGTREANDHLIRGSECLNSRDLDEAFEHFSAAIKLCPTFAEAYNQRATVHYLQERFEESLHDCRKAVELMPCHFGAWAGMGHCHAHRGELKAALSCYRRALAINTHLQCVGEMIHELETGDNSNDAIEEWSEAWSPRRSGRGCDEVC